MVRHNVNSILERVYYAIEIELASPLSVYVGKKGNRYTGRDVIRNNSGKVFIPGTSLTGAFRAYISRNDIEIADKFFGLDDKHAENKEGHMSTVYISDLFFEEREDMDMITLRKHLGVNIEGKRRTNIDVEVIEAGTKGVIYLNYVRREEEDFYDAVMNQVLIGIQQEEIRIGNNITRGYGHLRINQIYKKSFSPAEGNMSEWLEFLDKRGTEQQLEAYGKGKDYNQWFMEEANVSFYKSQYIKLQIPLKIEGGVSIRRNTIEPDKPDSEPLKSNDKPVIPGRRWAGATRSRVIKLLEELGCSYHKSQKITNEWFGFETKQSNVIFNESIMEDTIEILNSKGQIDRVTGTSKKNVGYRELDCYGGNTNLEIMVNKKYENYKALLGMMYLIMEEIQKGYIAVGGQTAVGKGIFRQNGEMVIDGDIDTEDISKETCLMELYNFL